MKNSGKIDMKIVDVELQGVDCAYSIAHKVSEVIANEILGEHLLVAWYDGQSQTEHPTIPECQHKPGWLAYAEGHAGRLRININKTEFCFIYADAL